MTISEFEARLGAWGESIQELQPTLENVAALIEAEIKSAYTSSGLKRNTNALYNSIDVEAINEATISFSILNYGLYQNYGVFGTNNKSTVDPVKDGFGTISRGTTFKFSKETIGGSLPFGVRKSIAEKGLNAKRFFDVADISTRFAVEMQTEIINQF